MFSDTHQCCVDILNCLLLLTHIYHKQVLLSPFGAHVERLYNIMFTIIAKRL